MTGKGPNLSHLPRFKQNPSDPNFYNNPYPAYQKMHALGSAFIWEDYDKLCFSQYQHVNKILRDRRFGRQITHIMSREQAGLPSIPEHLKPFYAFEDRSMLELEPPTHTRIRKSVNRAFISRNIAELAPMIKTLCTQLINAFPKNKPFDLLPYYCEKIPVLVIANLLGVPREMADQLLFWSHKMVAMYQFNRSRTIENDAVAATNEFSDYICTLLKEKHSNPQSDLLSALITNNETDLSKEEIVTTAILLLNAGHEATVHSLGNSVNIILQNNIKPELIFDCMQTTDQSVEELLRLAPPLHMFSRYVLEDLEFAGIPLKQGQSIGLLLGAANHDPKQFENPDKFDLSRGGEGHTSFGAGIHFCLGAPLARMEMAIALPLLFKHQPLLQLVDKQNFADRYHFHGLANLMVKTG